MRRKFWFLMVTVVVVLGACRQEEVETTSPIPEEQLIEIIAEALLVEPAAREMSPSYQDTAFHRIYDLILEGTGYDQAEFIESLQWLQEDPKRLKKTYEAVLKRLETIEKETK
ncbi:MAG: DUF4296 domain-containing protein [Bacteroidota bacterium]